jgi:hypothetical protein
VDPESVVAVTLTPGEEHGVVHLTNGESYEFTGNVKETLDALGIDVSGEGPEFVFAADVPSIP